MVHEAMEESRSARDHRLNQSSKTQKNSSPGTPLNRPATPSMINKLYGGKNFDGSRL